MSLRRKVRLIYRNFVFWLLYKKLFDDFQFYIASDPKEIREIFRLRYKVYCEEYAYIDKSKHPDGLEKDEYDDYSEHLIIRDKEHQVAATVRIIMGSPIGFPIEKNFTISLDTKKINRDRMVEISRLIVAKKYRKKHLLIFVLKGLSVLAINKNVSHAYCVIDEYLYPLLLKLHVPVRIIGEKQLYQGVTFPCIIVISEWIEEVRKSRTIQGFFTYKGLVFDQQNGKYVIH